MALTIDGTEVRVEIAPDDGLWAASPTWEDISDDVYRVTTMSSGRTTETDQSQPGFIELVLNNRARKYDLAYGPAKVTFDGTTFTLTRIASATSSSITALVSAAATLDILAEDINDNANIGWNATVLGDYGSWPTSRFRPTQGSLDAMNNTACLELFAEYSGAQRCNLETGLIWAKFPLGHHNIQVTYTGGFTTIPDDVIAACCELTMALHRQSSRDATLASEKLGDYSYTNFSSSTTAFGVEALSPMAAQLLQPFRRVRAL